MMARPGQHLVGMNPENVTVLQCGPKLKGYRTTAGIVGDKLRILDEVIASSGIQGS